jgi:hypothetical protein
MSNVEHEINVATTATQSSAQKKVSHARSATCNVAKDATRRMDTAAAVCNSAPKSWPTPPTMKPEVHTEVKSEVKNEVPSTAKPLVEPLAQDIPIFPMDEDDEEEEIPGPRSSMTSAATRKVTPVRRVSFGKPRSTVRSSSRGRSPDGESGSTSSTASWEQLAADSQPV